MRNLQRLSVPGWRSILVFGRPARTQYHFNPLRRPRLKRVAAEGTKHPRSV